MEENGKSRNKPSFSQLLCSVKPRDSCVTLLAQPTGQQAHRTWYMGWNIFAISDIGQWYQEEIFLKCLKPHSWAERKPLAHWNEGSRPADNARGPPRLGHPGQGIFLLLVVAHPIFEQLSLLERLY